MLYDIPQTRMLSAAQCSLSPGARSRRFSVLIGFMLTAMICTVAINSIQSTILSVIMIFDPSYHDLISDMIAEGKMDPQPILEYMNEFLNGLSSDVNIIFLATSAFYVIASIIYCRGIEKRSLFSMGFNKKGMLSEYLIGLLTGGAMISIISLVCLMTKCVTFSENTTRPFLVIFFFFVAFVLQGWGEEVLFRGFLLNSLCRRYSVWTSIIISSVAFSLFHLPNSGFNLIAFVNIALFGMFAAVFMLKRGSIWAVSAIHAAWNFMQGNVFGFSVSGNPKFSSVLEVTNANYGAILNGGDFGLEGGLGATVVLLAAFLIALLMPAKKIEVVSNSDPAMSSPIEQNDTHLDS